MKEWADRIYQLNQAKPLMGEHDSPLDIAKMLGEENEELIEAIENDCGDDPSLVLSEIADVLYLALYLCGTLGLDPEELVAWKNQRNELKYPPEELQEGDYFEQVRKLKEKWGKNGDIAWSHTVA